MRTFKVQEIASGRIFYWNLSQMLSLINSDTSEEWQDYNEHDWEDGWKTWAEGDMFTLLGET